jgi:hypothetical protein
MIDATLISTLTLTYVLLKKTAEDDILSAHGIASSSSSRPVLPSCLDSIYSRLVRAGELERDVEECCA